MNILNRLKHTLTTLSRTIPKRQRFIIAAFFLTFLLIVSTFLSLQDLLYLIPVIAIFVYFFTFFSLLEGISKGEWVVLFIIPVYFTVSFLFFYYFLPQRWLTRLPFGILYIISIYAVMLSQNIFNVGVEKSLQLARAAFSVNYLFITSTFFMTSSIIFSLKLPFYINMIVLSLLSLPLLVQFLWSIEPKETLDRKLILYGSFISLMIGEIALLISFLPLSSAISALATTGAFYSFSTLLQAHLQERLFKEKIREYLIVLGFIAVIILLTLRWN